MRKQTENCENTKMSDEKEILDHLFHLLIIEREKKLRFICKTLSVRLLRFPSASVKQTPQRLRMYRQKGHMPMLDENMKRKSTLYRCRGMKFYDLCYTLNKTALQNKRENIQTLKTAHSVSLILVATNLQTIHRHVGI